MRYNAIAPVTWSDPLVLKYGDGVKIEQQDTSDKSRQEEPRNGNKTETNANAVEDEENCESGPIPYPILEFRVGNDAFARDGGEIANVQISAWAKILAKNATQELRDACRSAGVNYRRLRKMRRERQQAKQKQQQRASPTANMHHMGHLAGALVVDPLLPETIAIGSLPGLALPDAPRGAILMDDGDCAGKCDLSHPTIYSRLALENGSHPFFKRCWHLRHQVDENSPLLDLEAHKIIRDFHKSGGEGWPPDLNSHEKLRKHVCFEELSVSLSGTDHITGNTVYGTAIYSTVDLAIGYRFINCLHRHPRTGQVGVDMSLINDVVEQNGGGGEPLFDEDEDDEDGFDPPVKSVNVAASSTNAREASGLSTEPMKED
ncbi:MAG: hypothetical protein SGARI_001031 [Bacillariaceae sp.]